MADSEHEGELERLGSASGGRAQERLEATWHGARDGLWDLDLATGETSVSPRWREIVGGGAQLSGKLRGLEELFRRVHPSDAEVLRRAIDLHVEGQSPVLEQELRVMAPDGGWRRVLLRGARLDGRSLLGGSLTDVTAEKEAESQLLHEAFHDPLTGLPNRQLFLDRLGQAMSRARRRGDAPLAVFYLDLDRFRTVNDSLGVDAGDGFLAEVARRLFELVRPGDTVARLGGDKFGLLMDGVRGPREAVRQAVDVADALRAPLDIAGHELVGSASIGIALSTPAYERPQVLLGDAVTAMHRAKERGLPHELFDPQMNARAKERMRLEADLRRALERDELLLHYQPIVSFADGRLAAFEALIRWEHPERGLVRPDLFIPIAEENGSILDIGRWVLEEACGQLARWHEAVPQSRDLQMAVNLSARQFEDPDLVSGVADTLGRSGLEARSLELEMTESVVMARTRENASTLQDLRGLGIRVMIDDFGTGYSSLANLASFPLDTLKIDRSFVNRMEFEEEKAEIVRTITTLAHNLGLTVVAEGVETAAQLAMLRDLRCQHGQGFLFSGAVDRESAAAWLSSAPCW